VLHHAQKILAIFAAMRDFARQLRVPTCRVRYVSIDDASNRQSIPGNLAALLCTTAPTRCNGSSPTSGGWTPNYRPGLAATAEAVDSEHFLTARDDLATQMRGRRQWLMEHFYRTMRRRYGLRWTNMNSPLADSGTLTATTANPGQEPCRA
jgi:deoxyribodipyrimidine photolyase-related protein